jgi:hypothetical protein
MGIELHAEITLIEFRDQLSSLNFGRQTVYLLGLFKLTPPSPIFILH